MEIRGAYFEVAMDPLGPRLKKVLLYRDFLVRWTSRYSCLPGTCDQVGKSTYVRNKFAILNK